MIENLSKLIGYSKAGIVSKDLVRTNRTNVSLFCMAKGTELSEHTATKEGFVYVIEGKGVFKLKGKDIPLAPGQFIFMEKSAMHSLKAEENTSFLLALFN